MATYQDKILPGFILRDIVRTVTDEDVASFLLENLGNYPTRYSMPIAITMFPCPDEIGKAVLVEGVLLSFNQIRQSLIKKDLGQRPVLKIDMYLGALMDDDAKVKDKAFGDDLHRQIMNGMGNQESLNLIRRSICADQLGKISKISDILFFRGKLEDIDETMLSGHLIEERASEIQGEVDVGSHVAIHYSYKLDALRDMILLNRDPGFAKNGGHFFFKGIDTGNNGNVELPVTIQPHDIFVPHDPNLCLFKDVFRAFNYIPLEYLSKDIFDWGLLDFFMSFCYKCHAKYRIVGIDIDLGWLAGTCGCDDNTRTCWRGERFTRLTLGLSDKIEFNQPCVPTKRCSLIEIVEGEMSSFQNVEHIKKSSLAVVESDVLYSRRIDTGCHKSLARIFTTDFLGYLPDENGLVKARMALKIKVPKSDWWNERKLANYEFIGIIKKRDKNFDHVRNIAEMIRYAYTGRLVSVAVSPDPQYLILHAVVNTQFVWTLEEREEVMVFAVNECKEMHSLRHTISSWQANQECRVASISGHVEIPIRSISVNHLDTNHKYLVTYIKVDQGFDFKGLGTKLNNTYVGVDVVKKCRRHQLTTQTLLPGRVFSIDLHESYTRVGVILKVGKGMNVGAGEAKLGFWCVLHKSDSPSEEASRSHSSSPLDPDFQTWVSKLYRLDHVLAEWGNTNEKYSLGTNDDSVPSFFKFHIVATPRRRTFAFADPIEVGVNYDLESIEAIVTDWKATPFLNDYSALEMILDHYPFIYDDPKSLIIANPRGEILHHSKRLEMHGCLYEQQNAIVESIVANKLTLVEGYAGSGKKLTSAFSVAAIYCNESDATLLLTATINSMSLMEVALDRILTKFDLKKVKVVKVVPVKNENGLMGDERMLHVLMRRHPLWNQLLFQAVVQKINLEGFESLNENEGDFYERHVLQIQMDLLKDADIILMPHEVVFEPRMLHLNYALAKVGRKLGSMVIMDGNQMQTSTFLCCLGLNPMRVAVFGDTMQMSPITSSWTSSYACHDRSWLELAKMSPLRCNERVYKELKVNRRMYPQIGNLVSGFGYCSKLLTPVSLSRRPLGNLTCMTKGFLQMGHNKRVLGYSYPSMNLEIANNNSYYNQFEIDIIVKIFEKMRSAQVDFRQVTVISHYFEQINRIRDRVHQLEFPEYRNAYLGTTDQFAGTENGIVIVSMVRSSTSGTLKGIVQQKRFITAVTRAKHFLIVVGDFDMMERSEENFYRSFLHNLTVVKAYRKQINNLANI